MEWDDLERVLREIKAKAKELFLEVMSKNFP